MGKTHYAHVDRTNESDNTEYWSSTTCGLEYTESLLTDKPKEVTCKNCLRAMARHKIDESVLLISGVSKRYWKCWKCGAVGFTEGELINNPPSAMCVALMPVRTSGVCGGSFNIEITEQEYNELSCNAC